LPQGAAAPDLPESLAALLVRDEERVNSHRDAWGCWEYAFSDSHHRGTLLVPEIDQWVQAQRRAGFAGEPLWPSGRPFALAVSHDVDDLSRHITANQWARQAAIRLRGDVKSAITTLPVSLWQARSIRPTPSLADSLEKALSIEAEFRISASWFFTVWPVTPSSPYDCVYGLGDPCQFRGRPTTIAELMRRVAAEGHDVGLHGSYGSALHDGALAAEKRVLETALGKPIVSTRQHWLHWRVDKTPRLQAEAGLKVDGTLGFNGSAGFRAGTSLPHPLWDDERSQMLDILELPLTVMDVGLFRPGAMGLDLALAKRVVGQITARVATAGGVLSLLIHPSHLVDPKVEALMRWTISHCLEQGAWTANHAQIRHHWDERAARLGDNGGTTAGPS
jgi:peptidoglycan/xylan/chitin deacetylase (PgdA/CDA1 family)